MITPEERENAERAFIRYYMNDEVQPKRWAEAWCAFVPFTLRLFMAFCIVYGLTIPLSWLYFIWSSVFCGILGPLFIIHLWTLINGFLIMCLKRESSLVVNTEVAWENRSAACQVWRAGVPTWATWATGGGVAEATDRGASDHPVWGDITWEGHQCIF